MFEISHIQCAVASRRAGAATRRSNKSPLKFIDTQAALNSIIPSKEEEVEEEGGADINSWEFFTWIM